jgi:hypothetical protein
METSNFEDCKIRPILKGKYFIVAGDPDAKADARSDNDAATSEHGKSHAVTEGAVRAADPGVPQTTSAGSNAALNVALFYSSRKHRILY